MTRAVDPIWLSEREVATLVDLPAAITAVEAMFEREARGDVVAMDKTHVSWGQGSTLHAIGAVSPMSGLVATKTWAHTQGGATPLLILWDADDGLLVAVLEAFALGQLRTAAVSGVATRHLAPLDADELAVIGSGKQALPQLAAVAAVRRIRRVRIFSPTAPHRAAFVDRARELDLVEDVHACLTVDEAVAGAHVVTTVTRARTPFLHAGLLTPSAHINAVGAISPERRELAGDVVERATAVVADSVPAARRLAAELGPAVGIDPLSEVVRSGSQYDRGPGLSIFKAMGVGLGDLAISEVVLRHAHARQVGRSFTAPTKASPSLKDET